MTYNILAESLVNKKIESYVPAGVLNWNYRRELILKEVEYYQADFLCLQVRFSSRAVLSISLLTG